MSRCEKRSRHRHLMLYFSHNIFACKELFVISRTKVQDVAFDIIKGLSGNNGVELKLI